MCHVMKACATTQHNSYLHGGEHNMNAKVQAGSVVEGNETCLDGQTMADQYMPTQQGGGKIMRCHYQHSDMWWQNLTSSRLLYSLTKARSLINKYVISSSSGLVHWTSLPWFNFSLKLIINRYIALRVIVGLLMSNDIWLWIDWSYLGWQVLYPQCMVRMWIGKARYDFWMSRQYS